MDMPLPPDNPQPSPVGQQIASAAQGLDPQDLTTLMHGISPEALEVMEKIPELGAFANLIESGGKSTTEEPDVGPQGKKPGIAIMIGIGKPRDPRSDIADAAAKHGIR